jgi:hypothetical protein
VNKRSGLLEYRGDRAYQIEEAAAHPAAHYPCRVNVRNRLQDGVFTKILYIIIRISLLI